MGSCCSASNDNTIILICRNQLVQENLTIHDIKSAKLLFLQDLIPYGMMYIIITEYNAKLLRITFADEIKKSNSNRVIFSKYELEFTKLNLQHQNELYQ